MSTSMKSCITEHDVAPTPPLPISSPPLPLPSPLTTSPADTGAPLGYRAVGIRMRALLPPTSPRTDIPEAKIPPQKRACFITPALGLEVGESSAAGTARQPWPTLEANHRCDRVEGIGYGITDTWDEIVEAIMEIAPTTLEGVNQKVTELATTVRQDTEGDRPFHRHTVMLLDREATYARRAWASSEDRSAAIEAHVRTLEAQVATLIAQSSSLQTQLTTALGRIKILEARDSKPQEEPVRLAAAVNHTGAEMSMTAMTQEQAKEDKAVGHDVAYAMPWKTLKKMMTDKYCPGSEIKKLETKM
nr:hypothetical protein [Tanacetum cinerariifolium]